MLNFSLIKDSGLHDYEIMELEVKYCEQYIDIIIKSPKGEKQILHISQFISCKISHEEPWGKGKYIVSSENRILKENVFLIEIELNSGDMISVEYINSEKF